MGHYISHKARLLADYDQLITIASKYDAKIIQLLSLLREESVYTDYNVLGKLLRDETTIKKIQALNHHLMLRNDLTIYVYNKCILGIKSEIISLLKAKKIQEAIVFCTQLGEKIIAVGELTQQELMNYGLSDQDHSDFLGVYTKLLTYESIREQVLALLAVGNYSKVLRLLRHYHPKGHARDAMFAAFQRVIEVYKMSTSEYDNDAFIGLLLLNMKNIKTKSIYGIFSPTGTLFGNKLYLIYEMVLKDLGVNLNDLKGNNTIKYTEALNKIMNQDPKMKANFSTLATLAIKAKLLLPNCNAIAESTIQLSNKSVLK